MIDVIMCEAARGNYSFFILMTNIAQVGVAVAALVISIRIWRKR